ncbi:MAG: TfoX/Sxy family protein [Alphaproteobacteria bacterium]|nr:TfoX/Sxy family protein [Alphaproteobacteria bacterium]
MSVKNRPIERLRNIGHVTAYDLKEVGIPDEKTLHELGAVAAYQRLKGLRPRHYTVVGLWALAGAIHDCPWNQLPPAVKKKLDKALANGVPATLPSTVKPVVVAKPPTTVLSSKPQSKQKTNTRRKA